MLEATNNILTTSAQFSNKVIKLGTKKSPRSASTPLQIRKSANNLLKKHKHLKNAISSSDPDLCHIQANYISSRNSHRKLLRAFKAKDAIKRDTNIYSICEKDPRSLFKSIRAVKRGKVNKVKKLKVDQKTYLDDAVCDGFFDAISNLKTLDDTSIENSEYFDGFSSDYRNILKICESGAKIPQISENDSFDLLNKMKPEVNDYYDTTPNHYVFAGPVGWKHFHLLLTTLIDNANLTDIREINTIFACILFKGHNKDKQSSSSI